MDIGALINNPQPLSSNAAARADIPVIKKSEVDTAPVQVPAVEQNVDIRAADEKRLQMIKDALKKSFKEIYAVSDQSFTIYKDVSGQYITRFTNLRDGSVTYVPEAEVVKRLTQLGLDANALSVKA